MKFENETEETLWSQVLVAYLQGGGDTTKGAHLKFADRCIEGRRKRQGDLSKVEAVVAPYVLAHGRECTRTPKALASMVVKAIKDHPNGKIQGIKQIRVEGRYGLREAKDLYELVQARLPE